MQCRIHAAVRVILAFFYAPNVSWKNCHVVFKLASKWKVILSKLIRQIISNIYNVISYIDVKNKYC
ncbi:hypothetical protein SAMN04488542_1026 [Fontibacillus panacisegetis]|uniref:Uncharacterized protein n=1 Tax=Fontibacillus panacisegetis TaxID=670482 RepID=A0A1G7FIE8_9BACL|nr:hypothetical protein SAMN04488542_1026 [Fontibacillus panacisegetis]